MDTATGTKTGQSAVTHSIFIPDTIYITPYLPREAIEEVRSWRALGKAAFVKVVGQLDIPANCKNCAGLGAVNVVYAENGPFKDVPDTRKVITWFDGGPGQGKGWYIIARTMAYKCPHCGGKKWTKSTATEE